MLAAVTAVTPVASISSGKTHWLQAPDQSRKKKSTLCSRHTLVACFHKGSIWKIFTFTPAYTLGTIKSNQPACVGLS